MRYDCRYYTKVRFHVELECFKLINIIRRKEGVAMVVDAGGSEGMGQFPPIPISRLLHAPQYGYGDVAVWIAEPSRKRRNRALSLTVLSVDSRFMIVKVRVKGCFNGRRPDVQHKVLAMSIIGIPRSIVLPSFLMVLVPYAPTPNGYYHGQECLKAGYHAEGNFSSSLVPSIPLVHALMSS